MSDDIKSDMSIHRSVSITALDFISLTNLVVVAATRLKGIEQMQTFGPR